MIRKVCGNCEHYVRIGRTTQGECYYNPPIPHPGGFCSRPVVGQGTQACAGFSPVPDDLNREITTQEIKTEAQSIVTAALANGSASIGVQVNPKYPPRGKRAQAT